MLQLRSNAACSCRPQAPTRPRIHQFGTLTSKKCACSSVHVAAPASSVGIVGLQGICSPSAYTQQWQRATRPQLEAQWGNILRTNSPERLLFGLDGLLMQLRTSRSLAVHIQQQHEDHEWATAAAQVAADCKRYESYIHTNKTVAAKLRKTHARLLQAVSSSTVDQKQQTKQQRTADLAGTSPQQSTVQEQQLLLQLCSVLLAVINDNLSTDSLEWLAALEVPDSNAAQLQQLKKKEQEIVAAIDAVLSAAVAVQLPASTSQLLSAQPMAHAADRPADNMAIAEAADAISAGAGPAIFHPDEQEYLQEHHQLLQHSPGQVETADQPQLVLVTRSTLVRLLQQCDDVAVRQQLYTTVLLPKLQKATALLEQLAACRHYQAQLSGYSSFLEQTRQRIAFASRNDRSRDSSQVVGNSHGSSVVDFLLHLSQVLKPLVQQEVDWVVRNGQRIQQQQQQCRQQQCDDMQQGQVPAASIMQEQEHIQQQQLAPELDQLQQLQQQSKEPVQGFGPWDWDWLLHQTSAPLLQQLRDPMLSQHMHLSGVVCGFSNILQQVLGVQLLLRPAGKHEVWGTHVHALMVVRQQQQAQGSAVSVQQRLATESSTFLQGVSATQLQDQQLLDTAAVRDSSTPTVCSTSQAHTVELLGVVYLDIGGGYGTRMLRYTRQEPGELAPVATAAAASCGSIVEAAGSYTTALQTWDDLGPAAQQLLLACCADVPAVAVGMSGGRILVQRPANTAVQSNMSQQQQEDVVAAERCSSSNNNAVGSNCQSSSSDGVIVLSVPQLWELGHEMGHALHLVLSSRQRACHLSGRYLPPSLLEVPSQLFEHLFTSPSVLAEVCLHHATGQALPQQLASAVTDYYGAKYRSALTLAARASAGLAEQMYGQYGDESAGSDIWRGSWEMLCGLPGPVAARGSLKELSILPVMAAHSGTYHCYLISWIIAAQIAEHTIKPLLRTGAPDNSACTSTDAYSPAPPQAAAAAHACADQPAALCQPACGSSSRFQLQQTAMDIMSMAAAKTESQIMVTLANACGAPGSTANAAPGLLNVLLMPEGQLRADLHNHLWRSPR